MNNLHLSKQPERSVVHAPKGGSVQNKSYLKLALVGLLAYTGGFSHGVATSEVGRSTCECNESFQMEEMEQNGMIKPFERTPEVEFLSGHKTDTYTFFHHYLKLFGQESPESPKDFENLPLLFIWPNYFEAYHNHWQRYRGKTLTFMDIGVQSGGKIPLLREYFGPGLTYVGVDINPSCKMFESADWVDIEIGDTGDRNFLRSLKKKYPKVDIFLDDGGHTMEQQRLAMEVMLPHVASDGVYVCEDLSTSWSDGFGGKKMVDTRNKYFREKTMMGLVHRSIDWLHYGWISGRVLEMDEPETFDRFWPESWWKNFALSVKHVHMYNQVVVYEKGSVETFNTRTVGYQLPVVDSGSHDKVDWKEISDKIASYTRPGASGKCNMIHVRLGNDKTSFSINYYTPLESRMFAS